VAAENTLNPPSDDLVAGVTVATPDFAGRIASSAVIAAAVGGLLVWAHLRTAAPLPAFWLGAIFLVVVTQQDVWRRKIPNWATGTGMLVGLGFHTWQGGVEELLISLAGIVLPLILLFAVYAAKVVGAGDVKALMVLGGLWGVPAVLSITVWTVFAAGAMGLVLLIARSETGAWLGRWGRMIRSPFVGDGFHYIAPESGAAARFPLPVATAIALASVAHLTFGGPWL
jgi:Flp pilus assembly protein protease CpaA